MVPTINIAEQFMPMVHFERSAVVSLTPSDSEVGGHEFDEDDVDISLEIEKYLKSRHPSLRKWKRNRQIFI